MNDTQLFIFWSGFMDWLWERTESFPKKCRFTLANRLDNLSLDILEDIVESTYTSAEKKVEILRKTNIKLEKMRVILRIASQRRFLPPSSLGYAAAQLQEAGKMLGGWIKNRDKA